jgi:hypothetical protein
MMPSGRQDWEKPIVEINSPVINRYRFFIAIFSKLLVWRTIFESERYEIKWIKETQNTIDQEGKPGIG